MDKEKKRRSSGDELKGKGQLKGRRKTEEVRTSVSTHTSVHVWFVKMMEIEPLEALSSLRSRGTPDAVRTKAEPSKPVSAPFITVRTTAAAPPLIPPNASRVFASQNPILSLSMPQRRHFSMI